MKKIYLLSALLIASFIGKAQNGLECVDVEVYYVSNANDTVANSVGGVLPIGSVTYRLYADMLPGYKFEGAYGVPGHELRLETTTLFFNNIDRGATSPTYTKPQAATNTVMLDSWFSSGAACMGNYGIMKSEDDGVANAVNTFSPQVLQNNDTFAGIPLTVQDGFITGTPAPEPVTFVGFTTAELDVFDAGQNGNLLSTTNATWASLNGSYGPDTLTNKVLIGQFTTDGTFSFKLNLQIGTPSGGVQNFVAENPVASEILLSCLIFNSDSLHHDTTGTSGLPYPASSPSFNVFPNPANDFVNVTINADNSDVTYTLFDMQAKNVMNKSLGNLMQKTTERIDLSGLVSGIYILELNAGGISYHKKIIKF